MLLQFRMLSDEDDNFLRDYLLPPAMTLADLHAFICDDIKYECGKMMSFFIADEEWNKLSEYTSLDFGPVNTTRTMREITLADVIQQNHGRLIYQFDAVENRAFYLELVNAKMGEEGGPQLLFANGEAPDQFDPSLSPENRSIFDEIMSDFNGFDNNEDHDDEW